MRAHPHYIKVMNPCGDANGGCSHFCLLSAVDPRGYSCDCPERMVLGDDMMNCTHYFNDTTIESVLPRLNLTQGITITIMHANKM